MSMYDKSHYNIVFSLKLIKINEKKKKESGEATKISSRKGNDQIYILKRSSSFQALSVRLVEFIYVLAVTMRIKAVFYR